MVRLVLVILFVAAAPSALAGGWTQPEGAHYAKVWSRTVVGQSAHTAGGDTVELPERFIDTSLNLYGEYGLTDTLTAVAFGSPIGWSKIGDASTAVVRTMSLGLRRGWRLGDTRLALEGHYGYSPNIGTDMLSAGEAEGEPFIYVPSFESHRLSAEAQLGHPLGFGWVSLSAGYRHYTAAALDPVIYSFAQLGWNLSSAWVLDLHFNLHEPLGEVDVTEVLGVGQTRYLGFGLGARYWLTPRFALFGGFEGDVYSRSNAATPSLMLGFESR
jgi:hypothetical protein